MSRPWLLRVVALVLVIAAGQVIFTLIDSDPSLLEWSLTAAAGVTLVWLASDVFGVGGAIWDEPLSPYARPDAAEDSVHHRAISDHLVAREPGPALRNLLLDLARGRDPDLTEPELRALAEGAPRRLSVIDIDRYLTRIEEPREHQ